MRILRLYWPATFGDHTLCYVDQDGEGRVYINDVAAKLRFAHAGEKLSENDAEDVLTIVLPQGAKIQNGEFLAVNGGEALLRWDDKKREFDVVTSGFLGVSAPVEIWRPIKTAVLTVSDKGSRGERVDTAGPELERLVAHLGGVVEERKIVPDEMQAIQDAVKAWCSDGYDLILTTGGTGLSVRDVTPEALLAIADKTVPGFGEMMRMETFAYTPRAFLTRGVAIVREKTLVIAFPGSLRGASQCFSVIAEGLRHGVETLAGWDAECGEHKRHHKH